MPSPTRNDVRLLSDEEQDLLVRSRLPILKKLSDKELINIVESLRIYRDRAQAMGKSLRRDIQRQTTNVPTRHDRYGGGMKSKISLLVAGVKRANKELTRRLRRKRKQWH